jgi:replicative DNA helicase
MNPTKKKATTAGALSEALTALNKAELIGDVAKELVGGKPQEYVPTGIKAIDDIIVGIVHAEVTLIAGKPGQGKTALAMTILQNAAEQGLLVGVFSLEMSRRALAMRFIAGLSGVPIHALRKMDMTPKQKAAVTAAVKRLKGLPLYVDDRSNLSGNAIFETMGQWKEMGIGLVAVDYVQLMSGENEQRQVQVGEAIRAVKAAAKTFDLPVMVLSQVNRASDIREDKKPRMGDLRDSGELEQVSDTILMFHYPEDDKDQSVRVCDIHVVKQKNGPTGIATVKFDQQATRFKDF